jgi:hypothetical protein
MERYIIQVIWYKHSHNLHYVWDIGIIAHRLLDYTKYLIDNIRPIGNLNCPLV